MESSVEFVAVDMFQATRFTIHIMAAVAEQQAEAIYPDSAIRKLLH